jgi:CRISPR system Cascade subunit CasA
VTGTFNLVNEPWIPCVKSDGEVEPAGIFQTLVDAGQYVEVRDPSPLVTASLHRLLLAVLHRVVGTESPDAWADLWQNGAGRFDEKKLEAYLKEPAIYSRFDLFDEQHPFYQTASLAVGPPDKKTGLPRFVKPIWQMAHELAYSDNMNLFAHFTESDWETRPAAEAARWLVAFQGFALGGLITTEEGRKTQDGSANAGQLVKSAVVLAKGENLFQTLMLNLVHYSADDEAPFAFKAKADRPAWERDDEQHLKRHEFDRRYDGYLDLLTWQSRRVKLVAERDREGNLLGVSGVVTMKGFQLPDNYWRYNYETMVGYIRAKDAKGRQDPWPPLGFRSGKDLWRDSQALLQSITEGCQRPRNISWVDELRQAGHLSRKQIQVDVAGMSAAQHKVMFWRHETLPVPLAYLDNAELIESLKHTIQLAEDVGKILVAAVRRAAATALKPGKDQGRLGKTERDAVEQVVQSLGTERLFWSRLEEPFRRHLQELAGEDAHRSTVIHRWFTETLQPAATDAYRRTAGEMEDSSRALRAAVSGEEMLRRELGRIAAEYRFVTDTARKEATHGAIGS